MPFIDWLPPELLAEVFYWYIVMETACQTKAPRALPRPYSWLAIRHVCRKWRHVALTFPALSTFICLTRPECVDDLLRRSGTLPIHVFEPFGTPADSDWGHESCRLVLGSLARIVSARLTLTDRMLNPEPLPELLGSGVSQLRSLHLRFWIYPARWQDPEAPLFPNFEFPHLRELSCRFGSFPTFRRMILPTLRQLHIVKPKNISPNALLAALESLQALEELVLDQACDGFQEVLQGTPHSLTSLPDSSVILPRLRLLIIQQYHGDDGIHVLHRVIYPATTSVTLHFRTVSEPHLHDLIHSAVLAKLEGRGVLGPALCPRSMAVVSGFDLRIHLALWASRQPLGALAHTRACGVDSDAPFFQLSMSYAREEWASRLLGQLPLAGVESALLAERVVNELPLCRVDVIGAIPGLEELKLEYESFDCEKDGQGTSMGGVDVDSSFLAIKRLEVHELHHASSVQGVTRPSRLKELKSALAVGRMLEDTHTKDISIEYTRSNFHSDSSGICHCSTFGPHIGDSDPLPAPDHARAAQTPPKPTTPFRRYTSRLARLANFTRLS